MANAIADLPDAYRAEFMAAQNLTDMQNRMADVLSEESKKMAQSQIAAELAKKVDDADDLLGNIPFFGLGNDRIYKDNATGQRQMAMDQRNFVKNLSDEDIDTLANADPTNIKELGNVIDGLQSSIPGLTEVMKDMLEVADDADDIADALVKEAEARRRNKKLAEDLTSIQNDRAKVEARRINQEKNALGAINDLTDSLSRLALNAARKVDDADRLRAEQKTSDRNVQLKSFELDTKRMSSFVGPQTAAQVQDQIRFAQMQNTNSLQRQNLIREGRGASLDAIIQAVQGTKQSKESMNEDGPTGKNPKALAARQRAKDAQELIARLGRLRLQKTKEGASSDDVTREALKILNEAGTKQVLGESTVNKLKDSIDKNGAIFDTKIADLLRKQEEGNKIFALEARARQRQLRDQKDLAMGGGINAFLDPTQFQPIADELMKGLSLLGRGAGSIDTGRGATKVANAVRKFMGGTLPNDPAFQGLRQQGIQGIAANMKVNRNQFSSLLRSRGQGGVADVMDRMTDDQFTIAATKQYDKLIQMEQGADANLAQIALNTKAMLEELRKENEETDKEAEKRGERATSVTAQGQINDFDRQAAERRAAEAQQVQIIQRQALEDEVSSLMTKMPFKASDAARYEGISYDKAGARARLRMAQNVKGGLLSNDQLSSSLELTKDDAKSTKRQLQNVRSNLNAEDDKAKIKDIDTQIGKLNNYINKIQKLQNRIEELTKQGKDIGATPKQPKPTARPKPGAVAGAVDTQVIQLLGEPLEEPLEEDQLHQLIL